MKHIVKKGQTSYLAIVFIQSTASTTGQGLTGLTNLSAGLTCYRARGDDGDAGGTSIALSAGTRGTWSSGGFKEKDSTNMPGVYEIGIPDAALATGSNYCLIYLQGATNMAPLVLEFQLVAFDPLDSVHLGLSAIPNATAGAANGLVIAGSNAAITFATWTSTGAMSINGVSNVAQTGDSFARIGALGAGLTAVVAASVTGAVGSVTGNVGGNVVGSVASVTGNVGGNVVGSVGSVVGLTASDVGAIKTKTDFLPSATAGAAGGVVIAGSNAATTFATLTSTGAFSINGVSNVSQTGDSFARIGANGSGLTAVVAASVTGAVGSVTGNVGGNVVGSVASVTGNVGGNVVGSVASVTGNVGGNVVGSVASVTGNVGGNVVGSVGSVSGLNAAFIDVAISSRLAAASYTAPDNAGIGFIATLTAAALDATVSSRATPAQVNAEVLDVLTVDTFAEPGQETPAATNTLAIKIGYTFKAWRNKSDQTNGLYQLYADDAVTVDQKAVVSDDGTTFTREEVAAGP